MTYYISFLLEVTHIQPLKCFHENIAFVKKTYQLHNPKVSGEFQIPKTDSEYILLKVAQYDFATFSIPFYLHTYSYIIYLYCKT